MIELNGITNAVKRAGLQVSIAFCEYCSGVIIADSNTNYFYGFGHPALAAQYRET